MANPAMPRTATVRTLDHGEITIPEPAWCIGHHWQPKPARADITHNSVRVKATAMTAGHGLLEIFQAHVSHAPYAELQPEPHPIVTVQLDIELSFDAEDVPKVVQALHVAAMRLDRLADEALRLRGGQS
ncbi:DUF6907 domain-containing protein [Streptomyces sp. NPDC003710]